MCRCADALRNGRPVDAALRSAFAPLRERRTIIAPGRVRLAVAPRSLPVSPWLRAPRIFGRLFEASVMVSVTLFAVGSSLESSTVQAPPMTPTHSVVQDYFRAQPPTNERDYLRWLRLLKPMTPEVLRRISRWAPFRRRPRRVPPGPGASPR